MRRRNLGTLSEMIIDLLQRAAELSRTGQPFALATVVRAERPTSAKPGAKAIVPADGALPGGVGGGSSSFFISLLLWMSNAFIRGSIYFEILMEKLGAAP